MNTSTTVAPRRSTRASLMLVVALLVATLAGFAATPQKADAYAWDSHVRLQGRIGCTYAASNTVKWAWVSASNGESGWASLGSGGMTRGYSFQFNRVPTSTMSVTVTWGCSIDGQHRTSFGVNRPTAGTAATRNICYWSPCLI